MHSESLGELIKTIKEKATLAAEYIPFAKRLGREPDFEVSYVFQADPELSSVIPCQGMRTDFLYEADDPRVDGVHMIWPEFLDESGQVILSTAAGISQQGHANMWIMNDSVRDIHRSRIMVGVMGWMVFGTKKLAKVRVERVMGLK